MSILNKQVNSKIFWAAVFVAFVLLAFALRGYQVNNRSYLSNTKNDQTTPQSYIEQTQTISQPDYSDFESNRQEAPEYLKQKIINSDIKISLQYESMNDSIYSYDYQPVITNYFGKIVLEVSKNPDLNEYGPDEYPIFDSKTGHAYRGSPIFLSKSIASTTIAYVGLRSRQWDMIKDLSVEVMIDFNGEFVTQRSYLNDIFGIKTASACGPGIFIAGLGKSKLLFDHQDDYSDIRWYKLDTPISIHNAYYKYCDDPPEDGEYDYCAASVNNLNNGNLRMNIFYKPAGKDGLFEMQMVNMLFVADNGSMLQPILLNIDDGYRAILK